MDYPHVRTETGTHVSHEVVRLVTCVFFTKLLYKINCALIVVLKGKEEWRFGLRKVRLWAKETQSLG